MEDLIKLASTVLQAGSIMITAYFAVMGLRAWRHQLVGKRKFEAAESILLTFYEAIREIEKIRSPFSFGHESNDRPGRAEESADLARHRDSYYPIIKRTIDASDKFSELERAHLICQIYFSDVAESLCEISRIRREVWAAATALYELTPSERCAQNIHEEIASWKRCIWDRKDDEINRRIASAKEILEAALRTHLSEAGDC